MDKNKISIIIPVYNAEDYLDRCIGSILDQNCSSYEVILVDDGSTDSSPLICDRYSSSSPRFRTVHKTNGGVSSARNAGLDIAEGEYIMFVDSDDALLPGALASMTENDNGEDLVIGGYTAYVSGVPVKDVRPMRAMSFSGNCMPDFFEENIRRNCEMLDAPWAKLFRRKAIGSLRFCRELNYAEDKLFLFSFMASCSSARTCPLPVYAYHLRAGSLGSDVYSDRHLMQLRRFLPLYSDVLGKLSAKYPSCVKVGMLYHKDLVGRYVCRILGIFASRRSHLLNKDYIAWTYSLMDADGRLGVFSLRPGQIFNILLYKAGNVDLSLRVYRLTSRICSIFHA
ncbi:MAG: glycosyltransferase [Bacteroidales bacterium]|nr:glycosyltransferase [Bacteroidales bacterium]MDE6147856.1 glycosyltransferase [Bacteroidales bacterium]